MTAPRSYLRSLSPIPRWIAAFAVAAMLVAPAARADERDDEDLPPLDRSVVKGN